jgi:hypothetical protein
MRLSIAKTLYRLASYINQFHECASASATARQPVGADYKIMHVDDEEPDSSLELAVKFTE